MAHFKITQKNVKKVATDVDKMLDTIKHSPCTYHGCGRKSIMRFVFNGVWCAACEDHKDGLLEQIETMKKQGDGLWVRFPK